MATSLIILTLAATQSSVMEIRDTRQPMSMSQSQPRKRKAPHPLEIRRLLVRPNTHTPVSDRKDAKSPGIHDHRPVLPPQNIPPRLAGMSLPHKHALAPSVPAVGHDHGETRPVGFGLVSQSSPANAVFCIEVVPLLAVCTELPHRHQPAKLASARGKSRSRPVGAEDVAPEHAGVAAVVPEKDQGVC